MIAAEDMMGILCAVMDRKQQIQSALDRQCGEGFTFQHVFDLIKNERALFFWNEDSCAVVEIRYFPAETNVHVFLGAGTTEGLLKLYDFVAEWGHNTVGAKAMTSLCRKGFKRTLAKHGWKEPQVWLRKELAA